jgi:hypothetical protein
MIDLSNYFGEISKTIVDPEVFSDPEQALPALIKLIKENFHTFNFPIQPDVYATDDDLKAKIVGLYFEFLKKGDKRYDFECFIQQNYESSDYYKDVLELFSIADDDMSDRVSDLSDQVCDEDDFNDFVYALTDEHGIDCANHLHYDDFLELLRDFLFEKTSFSFTDLNFDHDPYVEILYGPFFEYNIPESVDLADISSDKLLRIQKLLEMCSITPQELATAINEQNKSFIDSDVVHHLSNMSYKTLHSEPCVSVGDFYEIVSQAASSSEIPTFMTYVSLEQLLKHDVNQPLVFDGENVHIVTHDGHSGSSVIFSSIGKPLLLNLDGYDIKVSKDDFRYSVDDVCGITKREYRADLINLSKSSKLTYEQLFSDRNKSFEQIDTDRQKIYLSEGVINKFINYNPGDVSVEYRFTQLMDYLIESKKEKVIEDAPTPTI